MPLLARLPLAIAALLLLPAAAFALAPEQLAGSTAPPTDQTASIPDRETMQREITQYRSQIRTLQRELHDITAELDEAADRIAELEASLQYHQSTDLLHRENQRLLVELRLAQQRIDALEHQIDARPSPRVIAPAFDPGDSDELNERALQLYAAGDYETAVPIFRQAAERDHPGAIANLAAAYLNGHAVPQDVQQAVTLLSRSSALGNVVAAENLGRMYEEAIGVGFDRSRSITWWARAQALGSTKADAALLRLRGPAH